MNYDDLTDEQKEVWDHVYEIAFDAGWEEGFERGSEETDYSENYDAGYTDGYRAGIKAEQDRIQAVLGMMFESALNMGQGNKAVQYKHAMDLLKPLELKYTENDDF